MPGLNAWSKLNVEYGMIDRWNNTSIGKTALESAVEAQLVARVEQLGGVCEKVVSPGRRGYFDRVAVLPGGRVVFIEVKRPRGGTVRQHQKTRHDRYRQLGAEVALIRSVDDIDRLMKSGSKS